VLTRMRAASGLSDDSVQHQRLLFQQVRQQNERTNVGPPQQLGDAQSGPASSIPAPRDLGELHVAAPSQPNLIVIPVQPTPDYASREAGAPGTASWPEAARVQLVPHVRQQASASKRGNQGICKGCLLPLAGHRRGAWHAKCPNKTTSYEQPSHKKGVPIMPGAQGGGGSEA
jgi:hypothetical protein